MIELISIIIYLWLLFAVGKLLFKVAWGTAKIIAGILLVLSFPAIVCTVFVAGSLLLLLPVGLLVVAACIIKGEV